MSDGDDGGDWVVECAMAATLTKHVIRLGNLAATVASGAGFMALACTARLVCLAGLLASAWMLASGGYTGGAADAAVLTLGATSLVSFGHMAITLHRGVYNPVMRMVESKHEATREEIDALVAVAAVNVLQNARLSLFGGAAAALLAVASHL